ncbi:uncharacterized protein LOC120108143 [Phoenix dactylifera]|uniref:Uncharacterized protein LOC120108143 n=1 Tax=Phoenix dactylifera TaxID=42345 RepID=A0A8B8ZTQ3_PHODC|nr:uncharacterized protein LOC120108143 [Phoenix dactylifera]
MVGLTSSHLGGGFHEHRHGRVPVPILLRQPRQRWGKLAITLQMADPRTSEAKRRLPASTSTFTLAYPIVRRWSVNPSKTIGRRRYLLDRLLVPVLKRQEGEPEPHHYPIHHLGAWGEVRQPAVHSQKLAGQYPWTIRQRCIFVSLTSEMEGQVLLHHRESLDIVVELPLLPQFPATHSVGTCLPKLRTMTAVDAHAFRAFPTRSAGSSSTSVKCLWRISSSSDGLTTWVASVALEPPLTRREPCLALSEPAAHCQHPSL